LAAALLVVCFAAWRGQRRVTVTMPVTESPASLAEESSVAAEPEGAEDQQKVLLAVAGLKEQACPVLAAVFFDADGFPQVHSADLTKQLESTDGAGAVELELSLPLEGTAAIAVFQDLDGNGQLTKNALGLPTEPYGFSCDARGTFGPPAFSKAAVELSGVSGRLEVRVR
jgi:uncharacterized protein (DUF2141 family)